MDKKLDSCKQIKTFVYTCINISNSKSEVKCKVKRLLFSQHLHAFYGYVSYGQMFNLPIKSPKDICDKAKEK